MKRKRMIISVVSVSLLTITALMGFAQGKDPVLAEIHYDFTHVTDISHPENPRKEEMVLYIGKNSSAYKSYTLAAKTEEVMKQVKGGNLGGVSGMDVQNMMSFNSPGITNEELYNFRQEKKLVLTDKIGLSVYNVPQEYPVIDWQISNETREIGGYKCQRANAAFRGRNYTAWFTTELPFPYGPWKLNGLPGLILQAEDSKKEVMFNYAGFDKKKEGLLSIELPNKLTETNAADLARAKEAFQKDPAGNIMKGLPTPAGATGQAQVIYKDESGNEITKEEADAKFQAARSTGRSAFNNPLELSRK